MRYIFAFICGLVLVPNAIAAALVERGYTAVGGEILVPVLAVLMVSAFDTFKDFFQLRGTKDDRRTNKVS